MPTPTGGGGGGVGSVGLSRRSVGGRGARLGWERSALCLQRVPAILGPGGRSGCGVGRRGPALQDIRPGTLQGLWAAAAVDICVTPHQPPRRPLGLWSLAEVGAAPLPPAVSAWAARSGDRDAAAAAWRPSVSFTFYKATKFSSHSAFAAARPWTPTYDREAYALNEGRAGPPPEPKRHTRSLSHNEGQVPQNRDREAGGASSAVMQCV